MRPGGLALALCVLLAPVSSASHMTEYRYNPVEHDDQGRSDEPDGESTSVLGGFLRQCMAEVPSKAGFEGRCSIPLDPLPGQSRVLAPGCTGEAEGQMVRRLSGQCGLWTVGVSDLKEGHTLIPPQTIPAPASEGGMLAARAPGAFTRTKDASIRFLDGHVIWAPELQNNYHQIELNRKLADVSGGSIPSGFVIPGENIVHVWYGQWSDRNGNGVIDHVTPGSAGATQNEFAWLGSCLNLGYTERDLGSIRSGLCIDDPNPNADPPGSCSDLDSPEPCARTTLHAWLYPGNHHANGYLSDHPGSQIVLWVSRGLDCDGPPSCDEVEMERDGDPLLGYQSGLQPDITMLDTTGEPKDTVRRWYSGLGFPTMLYGDDGLLVTLMEVFGVNCGPHALLRYDPSTCTFLDVDRQPALNPQIEGLLVGASDSPNGGAKALLRSSWLLVRDRT